MISDPIRTVLAASLLVLGVGCGSEPVAEPSPVAPSPVSTEESPVAPPEAEAPTPEPTAEPPPEPVEPQQLVDAAYPFFAMATPRGVFVDLQPAGDDVEIQLPDDAEQMYLEGSQQQLGFVIAASARAELSTETTWQVFDGARLLCTSTVDTFVYATTVRAPGEDLACFPIPSNPEPVDPELRAPLASVVHRGSGNGATALYAHLSSAECIRAVAGGPAIVWARPRVGEAPELAGFRSVNRSPASTVSERASRWADGLARVRGAHTGSRPMRRDLDRHVFTARVADSRWTSVYLGIGDVISGDSDEHAVWDLWRGEGASRALVHSSDSEQLAKGVTPLWIGDVDADGDLDLAVAIDTHGRKLIWFEVRDGELRQRREASVIGYCPA